MSLLTNIPLLLTFALLIAPSRAEDTEAPAVPDLDTVRRELAARDVSIRNIAFRVTYHGRMRMNRLRGGPFVPKDQAIEAIIDTSAGAGMVPIRVRMDKLEKLDVTAAAEAPADAAWVHVAPDGSKWVQTLTVSTPEVCQIFQTAKEGGKIALVYDDPRLFWMLNPLDLLAICTDSPTPYLNNIGGAETEIDGAEEVAGHETIRVRWVVDSLGTKGYGMRGTYWVAPNLGYAVVREVRDRRPSPSAPWREIERTESADFEEVGGVWLPGKVTHVEHRYFDDGGYDLDGEYVATFENWKVNQDLPEDTFRLDVPPGTVVRDFTRGDITYVKGEIDDPTIKRQASQAQELASSSLAPGSEVQVRLESAIEDDPFEGSNRWAWVLAVILVLVVASAAGMVVVRRSR